MGGREDLLARVGEALSMPDLLGVERLRTPEGVVWLLSMAPRCRCGQCPARRLSLRNGVLRSPRRFDQWTWQQRVMQGLPQLSPRSYDDGRAAVRMLHALADLAESVTV